MGTVSKFAAATAALVCCSFIGAMPALAKCTRLAFSVNDYGKDGPTKDAKSLLDKYIANWTSERGITKYNVGKKDVSCELFLNFIVFDEHTCRAEATVCWPGDDPIPQPSVQAGQSSVTTGTVPAPAPAKAAPKVQ